MRWGSVVVWAAILSSPAWAAPRPPGFYPAEQLFNATLTLRDRIAAQILLIAAGLQNSVPTEQLQPATFNATQAFQASIGTAPTGQLDHATIDRLSGSVGSLFQQWGFQEVPHPYRGRPIWLPQGMGLRPIPNSNGVSFRDPSERVEVHYSYFPGKYIDKEYFDTLASLRAKGIQVHYSALKDDWYVISSSSPQGFDAYRRYHIDGTGILGFTLFWNNARGNVNAERIAVLMSASLGAAMAGRSFVEPSYFGGGSNASPPVSSPLSYGGLPPGPQPASQAFGPGAKLKVVGVADNDALKIREQPNEASRIVSIIPPDGVGIEFLGDRDGLWLFVRYERTEGWVQSRFVASEPRRGRKLEEGE